MEATAVDTACVEMKTIGEPVKWDTVPVASLGAKAVGRSPATDQGMSCTAPSNAVIDLSTTDEEMDAEPDGATQSEAPGKAAKVPSELWVEDEKDVLREKQLLVEAAAVSVPLDERRLAEAVAARDASRRAYKDAIVLRLPALLVDASCATAAELRSRASEAMAETTAVTGALDRCRHAALQAVQSGQMDATPLVRRAPAPPKGPMRRGIAKAVAAFTAFEATLSAPAVPSVETDAAVRTLQGMLQGDLFGADGPGCDVGDVHRCLSSLCTCVETEEKHWAQSDPLAGFPCTQLLTAGWWVRERCSAYAQRLRQALERYEWLESELSTVTSHLETNIGALEATLAHQRDRVDEAALDLEEEATKLKRARRSSG